MSDATWLADPVSGDWNTGTNWSTSSVPTGTAFFGSSSDTAITFSSVTTSVGAIEFNPGASTYSFSLVGTVSSSPSISITGAGIVGSAGGSVFGVTLATLNFSNSSTADNINITTSGVITDAGLSYTNELQFLNTSTAANASIINNVGGVTYFSDASTAADANIQNNFDVDFIDTSNAGNSTITNTGGTITINGSPVGYSGSTAFFNSASAGGATIINDNGGFAVFADDSSGGQARIIDEAGGFLDISRLTSGGTSVGSIEGAGNIFLGSKSLIVGLNNLSTVVSGAIEDGGEGGGTGGSLVKVGNGTLTLLGANTYSGGTTVQAGTLALGNGVSLAGLTVVSSGASLTGGQVMSGDTLNVSPGGAVSGVAVGSSGTLNIAADGTGIGLKTSDANDQNVSAQVNVLSGGNVDGTTHINGGMLVLDHGAIFEANAKLILTHTAELVLGQNSFDGYIKHFGGQDFVDLSRIRFIGQGADATTATWTQTNRDSGMLQVDQGNRAADLYLIGGYTTANFGLQSDGIHGTTLTFIPSAAHG